jgi:hypothetical protein
MCIFYLVNSPFTFAIDKYLYFKFLFINLVENIINFNIYKIRKENIKKISLNKFMRLFSLL